MSKLRTGAAIAALLMAPLAAHAADLVRPYKAPPAVVPAYANWSGAYVGVNFGYGFGKSNWDATAVSLSPKGPLAGLTIGYNYQTGTWVWGLEGDWDWSGMKASSGCLVVLTCTTKNDWLGTARVRLGYAGWNNWLPYLTGGLAMGDIKASTELGDASKTKMGWAAGLGIEYAMMANWSLKAEYLYADLGKFDCGITCGAVSDNVSFKTNMIRGGVNYRF